VSEAETAEANRLGQSDSAIKREIRSAFGMGDVLG